jgi:hypothetical protein
MYIKGIFFPHLPHEAVYQIRFHKKSGRLFVAAVVKPEMSSYNIIASAPNLFTLIHELQ